MFGNDSNNDMIDLDILYDDFLDKVLSVVSEDENLIFSYETKNGTIKEKVISKEEYSSKSIKYSVNSIYIKGVLNCFVKDGILYLDKEIPLSTQLNQLVLEKEYFNIKYNRIHYDGRLSLLERILNRNLIETSHTDDSEEIVCRNLFANIKLKYAKLFNTYKCYLNKRIKEIYANYEDEEFGLYEDLALLEQQASMFVKATAFLEEWQEKEKLITRREIEELSEPFRSMIKDEISRQSEEFFDLALKNTILAVEGREFIPIDELAKEFELRIDKVYQLLKEYYAKNRPTSELISTSDTDYELIIARIESIFSFYEELNPYRVKIMEYKRRIIRSTDTQEYNKALEEYKQYLINALKESEDFAFEKIIANWKEHQDNTIYGVNPILKSIGSIVQFYGKEYNKSINQNIKEQYDEEYHSIIDRIRNIRLKKNVESMIKLDLDKEYENQLTNLRELVKRFSNDIKRIQVQESICNLKNDIFENVVEDDLLFDELFTILSNAKIELCKFRVYAEKHTKLDPLSKFGISQSEYRNMVLNFRKTDYEAILTDVINLYSKDFNPIEYKKIKEATKRFIEKIRDFLDEDREMERKFLESAVAENVNRILSRPAPIEPGQNAKRKERTLTPEEQIMIDDSINRILGRTNNSEEDLRRNKKGGK